MKHLLSLIPIINLCTKTKSKYQDLLELYKIITSIMTSYFFCKWLYGDSVSATIASWFQSIIFTLVIYAASQIYDSQKPDSNYDR